MIEQSFQSNAPIMQRLAAAISEYAIRKGSGSVKVTLRNEEDTMTNTSLRIAFCITVGLLSSLAGTSTASADATLAASSDAILLAGST